MVELGRLLDVDRLTVRECQGRRARQVRHHRALHSIHMLMLPILLENNILQRVHGGTHNWRQSFLLLRRFHVAADFLMVSCMVSHADGATVIVRHGHLLLLTRGLSHGLTQATVLSAQATRSSYSRSSE